MTPSPLPVILLAAGASTRMRGRDKLMEDLGGQPLLRHQARLAQSIGPVTVALPPAVAAMVMLADMPELEASDLASLAASVDLNSDTLIWRAATEDGTPGHPIIFAAALFDQLRQLSGDDGGRAVVRGAASRMQLVPLSGQRARLDLDTPEDWAAWRQQQR